MRAVEIVIIDVAAQHAAQMVGVENDYVIKAFTPDGADQPFDMTVHPGRMRPDVIIADSHGPDSSPEDRTVSTVIVTYEKGRRIIPRKRFRDLLREPQSRRMIQKCGDVKSISKLSPGCGWR